MQIFVFTIFSVYAAFWVEISTREAWAIKEGRHWLAQELRWRRPKWWHMLGEVAVAAGLAWQCIITVHLFIDQWDPYGDHNLHQHWRVWEHWPLSI